jgi:uncharacterized membrane protein YdbT with pleckstrin-like domain
VKIVPGRDRADTWKGKVFITKRVRVMKEKVIWKGNPSQITNLFSYIISGVLNLFIAAVFVGLWKKKDFGLLKKFALDIKNIPLDKNELLYICLALMFLPTSYAFGKWLKLKFVYYEVTDKRIKRRKGLFSIRRDYMEMYRVKDITVIQPLMLRIFSAGNILLESSDRSSSELILKAVPNVNKLAEKIRNSVEKIRDSKRIKEIDVN